MTAVPPCLSGDVLFIEPNSGVSGDMMLGALLDLGCDFAYLRAQLALLPLTGYRLATSTRDCSGIQATKFDVHIEHEHDHHGPHNHDHAAAPEPSAHAAASQSQEAEPPTSHIHTHSHAREHTHEPAPAHTPEHSHDHNHERRDFAAIRAMIADSQLSPWVKEKSITAFSQLAEAEGKIHGLPAEQVHFHEVGAVDSIIDIVGTMILLEPLAAVKDLRVISSAVNVGQGTIECQHGVYPVPAPATQALLHDVPVFTNQVTGELTTPTGAILLKTLVREFGSRPPMKIKATGYGAGARITPGNANVLRISLGEALTPDATVATPAPATTAATPALPPATRVAVIEATIDDMTPQIYGYFQEKALAAGALDVYADSIQMKKNRPAFKITCVCAVAEVRRFAELFFRETTTIGVRYTIAERLVLRREFQEVWTEYGPVAMKIASWADSGEASEKNGEHCGDNDADRHNPVNYVPEYEDCRRLASERQVPLKEVQAAAISAYRRHNTSGSKPTKQ